MTIIYKYFEKPVPIQGDLMNFIYICNFSKEPKKAHLGTTSNLIKHLNTKTHQHLHDEYMAAQNIIFL